MSDIFENTISTDVEHDLNTVRDKVEQAGQIFVGLGLYGFKTDELDVLDQATVSMSFTEDLPRETQRAMLKVVQRLLASMIDD